MIQFKSWQLFLLTFLSLFFGGALLYRFVLSFQELDVDHFTYLGWIIYIFSPLAAVGLIVAAFGLLKSASWSVILVFISWNIVFFNYFFKFFIFWFYSNEITFHFLPDGLLVVLVLFVYYLINKVSRIKRAP